MLKFCLIVNIGRISFTHILTPIFHCETKAVSCVSFSNGHYERLAINYRSVHFLMDITDRYRHLINKTSLYIPS